MSLKLIMVSTRFDLSILISKQHKFSYLKKMPKPETKLWHELKRITPQITWTRLENTSLLGTPDLLGYNTSGHFFTVELKITSNNKIRFSPHQISFHLLHPKNTFILAKKPSQGSCKLFPGTCILALVKEGYKNQDACCLSLDDLESFLESLVA